MENYLQSTFEKSCLLELRDMADLLTAWEINVPDLTEVADKTAVAILDDLLKQLAPLGDRVVKGLNKKSGQYAALIMAKKDTYSEDKNQPPGKLLESGKVDCVISSWPNKFGSTELPMTLCLIDGDKDDGVGKEGRWDQILFIDATGIVSEDGPVDSLVKAEILGAVVRLWRDAMGPQREMSAAADCYVKKYFGGGYFDVVGLCTVIPMAEVMKTERSNLDPEVWVDRILRGIPAKNTLVTHMTCKCGTLFNDDGVDNRVLHHDHLYDYARKTLLQFCPEAFQGTWLKLLQYLKIYIKETRGEYIFTPVYMCKQCNSIDSDLKDEKALPKDGGWLLDKYMSLKEKDLVYLRRIKNLTSTKSMRKEAVQIVQKRRNEYCIAKKDISLLINEARNENKDAASETRKETVRGILRNCNTRSHLVV